MIDTKNQNRGEKCKKKRVISSAWMQVRGRYVASFLTSKDSSFIRKPGRDIIFQTPLGNLFCKLLILTPSGQTYVTL